MRKIAAFLFAISLFISGIYSQTLEIEWGNFMELDKDQYIQDIVGGNEDGFYVLRSNNITGCGNARTWIDYYNATMFSPESSSELLMPSVNGMETSFGKLYYIDGKLILFTILVDEHRNQRIAYVQYINSDGTLKNKPREIGQLPIQNGPYSFNYELSGDGKKIMFYYFNYFQTYNGEEIIIKILDASLQEEFSKKLVLPLKERQFELLDFQLGKSGNIYISAKLARESKKGRSSTDAGTEFGIITYNRKKNDFYIETVEMKKNEPSSIIFGLDKDENIVVGGLYSYKTARSGEIYGAFYQTINPNTQKVIRGTAEDKESLIDFSRDRDFMNQFTYKRFGDPNYFYRYILKDIFFLDNGG
ncbi:MAG: hypothetical protein KJ607_02915, partial [Bacteroidetes bacterium]|nr:hypothetical protein [Bacteroidota bacterium]